MTKLLEGTCQTPVKTDMQWDVTYDGDGVRARQILTTFDPETQAITGTAITSYYMAGLYEETDGVARKYHAIAGMTVAMNDAEGVTGDSCRRYLRRPLEAASRRKYLLTDHLGSVVAVTDEDGELLDQQRYEPFGEIREGVGTITQTDFGYTGQRAITNTGLLDYNARAYDPLLMRFIQPDTIVPKPAEPQGWNRYSYVFNGPMVFTDPTGASTDCGLGDPFCSAGEYTPGGMMLLYDNFGIDEHITTHEHLNAEIDDYLRGHPEYSGAGDPYLGFAMGDNRDLKYEDLRIEYWLRRLSETGICMSAHFCLDAAEDLYAYYDLKQHVRGPLAWDASRVRGASVALDAAGVPLSLVGVGPIKPTTQAGARVLFWAGITDSAVSIASAPHPMYRLIALGGVIPMGGAFFNLTLLIWDLSEGMYELEYTPPIAR